MRSINLTANAKAYIDNIVKPTIVDFEKEPASYRRAFLACLVLFHTVDYIALQATSPNKQNLTQRFRAENHDFAIVDRVANAFKHVKAGSERSHDNKPLHVQAIFSRPRSFVGEMMLGLTYLGDTRGGVEIWNERRQDDLLQVVKRAFEFVDSKLSVP